MLKEPGFRPAGPADLPQIVALLTAANLPLAGVEQHLDGFLVAFRRGALAGCAALERYGRTALLRSVVVAESERNTGLGRALVWRLLDRAAADGCDSVVLLTTTAAAYFERFGFRIIPRSEVPEAALASAEFQGACPASAIVMRLDLAARRGGRGDVD